MTHMGVRLWLSAGSISASLANQLFAALVSLWCGAATAQMSCCSGSGCCGAAGALPEPCILNYGASGIVTNAVTGHPIAGATITVLDVSTTSAADGSFTVSGAHPDTCNIDYYYSIAATAPGYAVFRFELYTTQVFPQENIQLEPLASPTPTVCPVETPCPLGDHPRPCTADPCGLGCGCEPCPACGEGEVPSPSYNFCRCIPAGSTALASPTPTPTPSITPITPINLAGGCVGDCDRNGRVTLDELVTMVNIALGLADFSSRCLAGDADGDGSVRVTDIIAAVRRVLNGCDPTPTPTPAPTSTPTTASAVEIIVQTLSVPPYQAFDLTVTLTTTGQEVTRTENVITFHDSTKVIADSDGQPLCRLDPALNKPDSRFTFLPLGCRPYVDCTQVHAEIFAADNADAIPNGTALYTCALQTPLGTGTCTFTQQCSSAAAYDGMGRPIPASCVDGSITFEDYAHPTVTFALAIDPPMPRVGDAVTLVFSIGGGVGSWPQYTLVGADPYFDGDTAPQRFVSGVPTVQYQVRAARAGTAALQLSVNSEILIGCPGNSAFVFETMTSEPFPVEIADLQ
jgi:carboxypeptidase family protein